MIKQADKSNINEEFDFGYKKYLKERMFKRKEDSDGDSNHDAVGVENKNHDMTSTELMILKQSIKNLAQKASEFGSETRDKVDCSLTKDELQTHSNDKTAKNNDKPTKNLKNNAKKQVLKSNDQRNITKKITTIDKIVIKVSKPVATSDWAVEDFVNNSGQGKNIPPIDISAAFESLEDKVSGEVEKKLAAFRKRLKVIEKNAMKKDKKQKEPKKPKIDNLEYLKLKNNKQKAVIDEALIETGSKEIDKSHSDAIAAPTKLLNAAAAATPQNIGVFDIDPNRFIEVKPKYLNTSLSKDEGEADMLDDDEQVVPRVNIEDVFEEDDVVASFRQEKEDEMNKDKPEHIDLSLPGWGSWGGKGVKAPKRKKNRLIFKAVPKMPRRDENKGDIIIKEYKDPKLAVHKVKDIPFPFTSIRDYEASIRAPLGNTFVPEKAHKKLIQPSVITKAGAIIEPMDEDELLVKKNRNFINEKVLKILGKK